MPEPWVCPLPPDAYCPHATQRDVLLDLLTEWRDDYVIGTGATWKDEAWMSAIVEKIDAIINDSLGGTVRDDE